MRLALATDAWFPQVNGVVRSLSATVAELDRRGYEVELVTPQRFLTVPMPGYPSIRLAMAPRFGLRRMLDAYEPDIVHIATEGPIGWSARGWCLSRGVPFTSAFHTRFPDYASVRTGISAERFWPIMRRFHGPSRAVLVSTESLSQELAARGIAHTRRWSRGIDHWLFRPGGDLHEAMAKLPRPILLNVGRVAPEKNIEAFLDAEVEGSKVVVGDGPALDELRRRYPDVHFLGSLSGEELAAAYRTADCFVFPSLTDTFGLVVIEALASGVPVAAYPVTGPIDILGPGGRGADGALARPAAAVGEDLATSIRTALTLDRDAAAALGRQYSWENATEQFLDAVEGALADHRAGQVLEPA
ncbi:GDP-mannose-dependent alpha-mannosyltransferase [Novosphingobium marinum]|uniref:Glycosyltransferase involved in cell wall biosynthesis n=1 Tax=Novosphingobium marinum TaxID=1514948 RepID=A0A7Y9Y024_9SPHN|nr:glycosyltransferase family 1 protein [Novosphingobium marinum]NYH96151.1 glycosyltransferase involved in cell wall biosynthesis [Novosphingobium marinum]GGC32874.1 GDP-mannose-dependent alpha-mannosyltransferase [Novosphingobium marinum]